MVKNKLFCAVFLLLKVPYSVAYGQYKVQKLGWKPQLTFLQWTIKWQIVCVGFLTVIENNFMHCVVYRYFVISWRYMRHDGKTYSIVNCCISATFISFFILKNWASELEIVYFCCCQCQHYYCWQGRSSIRVWQRCMLGFTVNNSWHAEFMEWTISCSVTWRRVDRTTCE